MILNSSDIFQARIFTLLELSVFHVSAQSESDCRNLQTEIFILSNVDLSNQSPQLNSMPYPYLLIFNMTYTLSLQELIERPRRGLGPD